MLKINFLQVGGAIKVSHFEDIDTPRFVYLAMFGGYKYGEKKKLYIKCICDLLYEHKNDIERKDLGILVK